MQRTHLDETARHQNRKRLRGHENRRVCDSKWGELSDTCHRLAVGVTYSRGWGFSLKGARAGPCDDEDKMCCQRERMKKEIKMSPLKLTKSVVIGVFQWKSLDIYYIFFSKRQNQGTTGDFPLFQRIVCTLIANLGGIFGIPANLDLYCKFWTVSNR